MKNWLFLLFVGFAFLLYSCKDVVDENNSDTRRLVKVLKIDNDNNNIEKRLSGIVKEGKSVNLAFKAAGKIKSISVKEGDFVKQGHVIAELENSDYQLQYDAAKAQYDQVNKEAARVEELYKRGSVSGNDYDKAVAGRKLVEVQLNGMQSMLDGTKIIAPYDGYVQRIPFSTGELVDAGMPIAELVSTASMEIEVFIPTSMYTMIGKIREVNCAIDAIQDKEFKLSIISVNPKSNNSQLYKMRLLISNPDQRIAPGMSAQVKYVIETDEKESLVEVPLSSLFERGGNSYVWVVDTTDFSVVMRQVELSGFGSTGRAAVSRGLDKGDVIVVAGVNNLTEGERVKN